MKNKKTVTVLITVLSVVFILSACGVSEAVVEEEITNIQNTADLDPEPLAAEMKTKRPEEIFRFETSALYGEGAETINPNGLLLNIGCEDCQDIFYASRSLTVDEVVEKLTNNFGIVDMVRDENFVRFDIEIDSVRKLELELDLIAAKKLEIGDEIVNIRIISIKP